MKTSIILRAGRARLARLLARGALPGELPSATGAADGPHRGRECPPRLADGKPRIMKSLWVAWALICLGTVVRAESLNLVRTIPLPQVAGRIDHLSLDATGGRLFVAALGNNTVEVVDLRAGKVVRSLDGFSEPQGVLFVPGANRLYVANGDDGSVRVLNATTFAEVATVRFEEDADNLRYDAAARQVDVGFGSGGIGIIDVGRNSVVATIPVGTHPESFQLERGGTRLFVNLPGAHTIAVVDRASRRVIGHWSLGFAAANFPMALDEAHQRAFVGCRVPGRLLVYDTRSGQEVARLDLHGDCDDLFYDPARRRIYASCGQGYIDVFSQTDADHYGLQEAVRTAPRARTCLFDGDRIYLAVPHEATAPARIEVYAVR